jgi:hypothetical protein
MRKRLRDQSACRHSQSSILFVPGARFPRSHVSPSTRVTACHDLSRDMSRLERAKSLVFSDLVTMSRLQPPGDGSTYHPSSILY